MTKNEIDILEIIDLIFSTILVIALLVFIFEVKDLHDDYKCSTTTDETYYNENKCERFKR